MPFWFRRPDLRVGTLPAQPQANAANQPATASTADAAADEKSPAAIRVKREGNADGEDKDEADTTTTSGTTTTTAANGEAPVPTDHHEDQKPAPAVNIKKEHQEAHGLCCEGRHQSCHFRW